MAGSDGATPPLLTRWARRAPVAVFLTGTFAWAWLLWGYWIPVMPPGGLEFSVPFLLCAIVGGFAPSLAAIFTSGLISGRRGIGELLRPLARWRQATGWYAVALLLVPLVTVISVLAQSAAIGPLHWVDAAMLPVGIVWPLMAALGEEIGWRGFLLPRLQPRYGVIASALLIGALWGAWHLPADYIGLKGYGDWFWPAFLVNGPVVLGAHALIMSWLWNRTRGNLLLMVLYHFSITASAILAPSSGSAGSSGVLAAAIGAGLLWLTALILLLWDKPRPYLPQPEPPPPL